MAWFSLWWVWVAAGFGIGVLEVLAPGFIFLGFAIGAVLTGGLIGLGIMPAAGWPLLLLVFAVLSVLAWAALRRFVGVHESQIKQWDKDIND